MTSLIIYASQFGNTKKVAQAIASAIKSPNKIKLLEVEEVNLGDLDNVDVLIIGSPTQGGRPTQKLQTFLDQIPSQALKNVRFATFDTRFLEKDVNFALRLLIKTIGYAAPKMAAILKSKGGKMMLPPEGFIVKGKKGPLATGEESRAKDWAKQIV
jgi:flavodoxin